VGRNDQLSGRFFSEADRVMNWWTELMSIAAGQNHDGRQTIQYQKRQA
jgi:hypothetical protein